MLTWLMGSVTLILNANTWSRLVVWLGLIFRKTHEIITMITSENTDDTIPPLKLFTPPPINSHFLSHYLFTIHRQALSPSLCHTEMGSPAPQLTRSSLHWLNTTSRGVRCRVSPAGRLWLASLSVWRVGGGGSATCQKLRQSDCQPGYSPLLSILW